jgi:hypothetical protein
LFVAAIKEWSEREIFAVNVTLEVMDAVEPAASREQPLFGPERFPKRFWSRRPPAQ